MKRRPHPHRRQKPQQSPSSWFRREPMGRFCHTPDGEQVAAP